MNRYPLWKYLLIGLVLLLGALYTAPNFFGQSPAVQISSGKSTVRVEAVLVDRVRQILDQAKLPSNSILFDSTQTGGTVRVRVSDTDTQYKVKDTLSRALNGTTTDDADYVVALNLITNTPAWLQKIRALPMYLGLDLRGG